MQTLARLLPPRGAGFLAAVLGLLLVAQAQAGDPKGDFAINQGLSGAWFNPTTPGQGFLIDIEPSSRFIFVAWFTFDEASGKVGSSGQRWLTAQGSYTGAAAELPLFVTSGGRFNDPSTVASDEAGSLSIAFSDCANGTVSYAIDDGGLTGEFPITRVVPGTDGLCEDALAAAAKGGSDFFQRTDGPNGGLVQALYRDADGTLYASHRESGRTYRSDDDGLSWTAMGFKAPFFNWVQAFASDPAGNLYLANGCGFSPCSAGNGVYRSTDGGATWTQLSGLSNVDVTALHVTETAIIVGTGSNTPGSIRRSVNGGASFFQAQGALEFVFDFAQTPNGTLFAADATGIYRSTNGGGAWTRTLQLPCCSDPQVAAIDDQHIVAMNFEGVFRSQDGGSNWTEANSGLPVGEFGRATVRMAAGPGGDVAVSIFGGGGVYLSSNQGASWRQIGNDPEVRSRFFVQDLAFGEANTVLLAADYFGLVRTANLGASWALANTGIGDGRVIELEVDPDGTLFASAYGRTQSSGNAGATWDALPYKPARNQFGNVMAIGADGALYAAADDAGLLVSRDGGVSYQRISTPWQGIEHVAVFDIALATNGDLYVSVFDNFPPDGEEGGVYRSTNGGASFSKINTGLPAPEPARDAPEVQRLFSEPGGMMFASVQVFDANFNPDARLYRLGSGAAAWADTGIRAGDIVRAMAFGPNGVAIAGTKRGLHRSSDRGRTWQDVSASLPATGGISAATFTPEGDLYVALQIFDPNGFFSIENRVLHSENLGASWTLVTDAMALPAERNAILSMAVADGFLYAGTETSGVYRSREAVSARSFEIDQTLFGAWFDPMTPGQGFLFEIEPASRFLFMAWFTFAEDGSKVGSPEHRWLTAQGSYDGLQADLPLYNTTGGAFDSSQAVSSEEVGSVVIEFADCRNAMLSFDIAADGLSGEIPITRVIPGTEQLCEAR